jgi:hypothetical protein
MQRNIETREREIATPTRRAQSARSSPHERIALKVQGLGVYTGRWYGQGPYRALHHSSWCEDDQCGVMIPCREISSKWSQELPASAARGQSLTRPQGCNAATIKFGQGFQRISASTSCGPSSLHLTRICKRVVRDFIYFNIFSFRKVSLKNGKSSLWW